MSAVRSLQLNRSNNLIQFVFFENVLITHLEEWIFSLEPIDVSIADYIL